MAKQRDKLSVELEVLDGDANAKIAAFDAKIARSNALVNQMAAAPLPARNLDQFSNTLATVQRQAASTSFELNKIGSSAAGQKGFDGISKAAIRARTDVVRIQQDLRGLAAMAAITREPALLKSLQREAIKAGADLDRLNNKIERVAAGRSAAAQRRGPGSGFDGRGLLEAASGAGVPFAFEASQGLDLAKAAGISTVGLAIAGGLAVAGVAIVKYSERARAEAELRLKAEESIAIAVNKQVLAGQEVLKNFEKQRGEAEFQRGFQADLLRQTDSQIAAQIKLAETFLKLSPTGPNAERQQQIILQGEAAQAARKAAADAAQAASFNQRFTDRVNAQRQAADFEAARAAEQARKVAADRSAGRAKVEGLGTQTDELFNRLFAQRGAANPFVAVFTEAEKAISDTTIATAALSAELQNQARGMVDAGNANALFRSRLDSALSAGDLRDDASRFRQGGRPDTRAADALAAFNARRAQETATGLFRNEAFDDDFRSKMQRAIEQESNENSPAARLAKQLERAERIRPENAEQRSEIDRRIIALTQSINPGDLSDSQRNAAALAREREAVRIEGAEAAARVDRAEQTTLQKSIDKNIADLLKVANSDGLTGVIRIVNDAEDNARVTLGKRPTAKDSKGLNEL